METALTARSADEPPSDMKTDDRLYQEVDDSCALCGGRGVDALGIHHIDGDRSNNTYENQIVLCHKCHKNYHDGTGVTDEHVRTRKRHLILKSVTPFGLSALKIASRNGFGVAAAPFLLLHLVDLNYLKREETISSYGRSKRMVDTEVRFSITPRGQEVLEGWLEPS